MRIKPQTSLKLFVMLIVMFNLHLLSLIPLIPQMLFYKPQNDPVLNFESSISRLRILLKKEAYTGYVSDIDERELFNDPVTVKKFYMLQYSLAPTVLDNSHKANYVIGIFKYSDKGKKLFLETNLKLIKDYGNGVVLFKNV